MNMNAAAPNFVPPSPAAHRFGDSAEGGGARHCKFFARGSRAYGDKCRWLHPVGFVVDESVQSAPTAKKRTPCRFFLQGKCKKGVHCPFAHGVHEPSSENTTHVTNKQITGSSAFSVAAGLTCEVVDYSQQSGNYSTLDSSRLDNQCVEAAAGDFYDIPIAARTSMATKTRTPCRFFLQGACNKGMHCPFYHEPSSKNATEVTNENFTGDSVFAVGAGLTCEFGPGAMVQKLIVGDQTAVGVNKANRISINGLCSEITDGDIENTLSAFGHVASIIRKHETYAFVKFADENGASNAVRALNGSTQLRFFSRAETKVHQRRPNKQKLQGCISMSLALSPGSIVTDDATIKVQWYAPSRVAWAHYDSRVTAENAAAACDGKMFGKRKVSAKFQPPGVGQRTSFSVWLGGLVQTATTESVRDFVSKHAKNRPSSVTLGTCPFRDSDGGRIVQHVLSSFGPLTFFQEAERTDFLKRKALAKYLHGKDASAACEAISTRENVPELGGSKIFVGRLFSAKFTVSNAVLAVTQNEIQQALRNLHEKHQVRHKFYSKNSATSISVQGDTPAAISFAKGTLQRLLSGDRVMTSVGSRSIPLWHGHFATKAADCALESLSKKYQNAYIYRDKRRREIRLYGETKEKDALKNELRTLLVSVMSEKQAVPLTGDQYAFCVHGGRKLMDDVSRAAFAGSVSLDIKSKSFLVEGDGATAKKALSFISKTMATNGRATKEGESYCPICFCQPGDDESGQVVRLECSHVYCFDCFHSWIDDGQRCAFPISCLAERCRNLVETRLLKDLLSFEGFLALLRASVDNHVNANLDKLQFCISGDCDGIYQLDGDRLATCSSCATLICTRCKIEEHEGLTCDQYQIAKLPPNRLRNKVVDEILTLRCPRCSQAFFDFDGCFSIKCNKCPCSFCGWCLADCGSDAHQHVRHCKSKHPSADSYFGTRQQFEEAQRQRQKGELLLFLETLARDERNELLSSLENDLKDLGFEVPNTL